MPELAEVEWNRRQWNPGLHDQVTAVALHAEKRLFRGTVTSLLRRRLTGQKLVSSEARGKRMLFRFTGDGWLGLHLGMTGSLRVEKAEFDAGKHDHLVLRQAGRSLVFRDARQFGRIQFHNGAKAPDWWREEVPEIVSKSFDAKLVESFLKRHGKAPIKAVLLLQNGFSGIGNWMADEILWRAGILPRRPAGKLSKAERAAIFSETKFVAHESLSRIGRKGGDVPKTWLMHERWNQKGRCPKHGIPLRRATIGGRTTAWCAKCQR